MTTIVLRPITKTILAALVGSFLLFFGNKFYEQSAALTKNGIPAEGTIVDYAQKTNQGDNHNQTYYYAIFEFSAKDGKTYRVTSDVGENHATHQRGDKIRVLYPEGTPESAILNRWIDLWFIPAVLIGMGGVCLIGAAFGVLRQLFIVGLWYFLKDRT
jgi:hypothetical protein